MGQPLEVVLVLHVTLPRKKNFGSSKAAVESQPAELLGSQHPRLPLQLKLFRRASPAMKGSSF